MKLRSYRKAAYKDKVVLYRATYDITLAKRGNAWVVPDDTRLRETIPSLQWLIKQKPRAIIILTWLGRPKRSGDPQYKLDPVARRLSKLLNKPVQKLDYTVGPKVREAIEASKPGSVLMLENVRFEKGEENNSAAFAKALAANADLMVHDAFGQSHRDVPSIVGIQRHLRSYAGPLLEREVEMLEKIRTKPKRPLVAIMGGVKIGTRIGLIKYYLKHVDYLLLGGALSNTILAVKGVQIGKSVQEPGVTPIVRKLNLMDKKLYIPVDVVTSTDRRGKGSLHRRPVGRVRRNEYILDIGPDTVALFSSIIRKAKMVVWNGPLGLTENPRFAYGTRAIGQAMAKGRAETIVGGGDTLAALAQSRLLAKYDHVCTAGGAMLTYLEYGTLPGLKPLFTR